MKILYSLGVLITVTVGCATDPFGNNPLDDPLFSAIWVVAAVVAGIAWLANKARKK